MLSLKENMLRAYQHKEPEYLPLHTDMDTAPLRCVKETVLHGPGEDYDWFGQSWTFEPQIGAANPTPGKHLVTDLECWREQMQFPDLDVFDWETQAAEETKNWDREGRLSILKDPAGMWERMCDVMDFMEALCALSTDPDLCYDFFGAVADHKIRLYDKFLKYYKPDIIIMHDDYATAMGLFMSPATWRELIKPHLKRIVDFVQSHGCIYEHHVCGRYVDIVEDLLELGIGSTNPVQPVNDLKRMKQLYGDRLTFAGGFDSQLISIPNQSAETIRQNVRDTMDALAPGGGWVCKYHRDPANPELTALLETEMLSYGRKFYGPRPDEE